MSPEGITPPPLPGEIIPDTTTPSELVGEEADNFYRISSLPPPLPVESPEPAFENEQVPVFGITPVEFTKTEIVETFNPEILSTLRERLQSSEEQDPFTKEEKEEFLKPEVLSALTTDEYIALWKKLSPHFTSHVTRQGFRETFSTDHSKGVGEFHNGFVDTLRNGGDIKSPFLLTHREGLDQFEQELITFLEGINLSELESDQTGVEEYPQLWKKIKNRLTASFGSAPKVPDEAALHLATEKVLTAYGAEQDNQIFYVFPVDMIASQFNFAFNGSQFGQDFSSPPMSGEGRWNDAFIWNKEDPFQSSLPINSGIVFLPKSTPVNPVTGSKYSEYRIERGDSADTVVATTPDFTITSEQYWTEYFADHPDLAPQHVVFYDGEPTAAVQSFLQEHGIVAEGEEGASESEVDEFSEHVISNMHTDSKTAEMERIALARGANALVTFLQARPDIDYRRYLQEKDVLEIQSLLS